MNKFIFFNYYKLFQHNIIEDDESKLEHLNGKSKQLREEVETKEYEIASIQSLKEKLFKMVSCM